MGVLLSKHSLTFAEDLVEDIEFNSTDEFIDKATERYDEAAKTCYVAGKFKIIKIQNCKCKNRIVFDNQENHSFHIYPKQQSRIQK
ncbi:hypothetical protein BLA29_012034 [Euroglyphus maynei]|uniref:Uncharacterized protein n=1 Tax=Euroglyphus maynei TaxID=6958 RepID=A0A1Y3BG71_EURMA|nr:hypothetical protein BLA29_012034 [Euroglyphus maynei]